jgi:hypothetical protein
MARAGYGVSAKMYKQGKERRAKFLELLQGGMPLQEAILECGWKSTRAYHSARKAWPEWKLEVDLAKTASRNFREAANGPDPLPPSGDHKSGFQDFVKRYFPDRRGHQAQQLELVDMLGNLRPREVCLALIWPEAGKTSTFEDYICRTLARDDNNHRFRIVSEGNDLSKRIVGTCVRRFTDMGQYPEFIGRYGPFYEKGQERKGRPWTTEQITILKNSGGERDRSLVASGWTSAVYGSRIDTLILDDIQSQRNFSQSEEIFRRIRGTFFNRGLEMRTLIVGTRIGPGDFYERILDSGIVTKYVRLAAAKPDGTPTVPDFWDRDVFHSTDLEEPGPCCSGFRTCPRNGAKLTPKEFMELIRHQSGEETWWAAYMQNPSSNERSTFAALLDRCLDHDRSVGQLRAS